jgi:hypothetical protein
MFYSRSGGRESYFQALLDGIIFFGRLNSIQLEGKLYIQFDTFMNFSL